MKKLQLFVSIFLVVLLLNSCKYPDTPKSFEFKEKFNIEFAPYLSKTKDIHPNAIFQAQNKYRDVYYILVPQAYKPDSLWFETLYDSLSNDLKKGVKESYVLKDTFFVNDKNYIVHELSMNGKVKEKSFFFLFQLIQKDTTIYQSAGWCFKNKKDLWEKDLRAINNSLTILQ